MRKAMSHALSFREWSSHAECLHPGGEPSGCAFPTPRCGQEIDHSSRSRQLRSHRDPIMQMGSSHADPTEICGISHRDPIASMGSSMGSHGISSRKSFNSWDRVKNRFFGRVGRAGERLIGCERSIARRCRRDTAELVSTKFTVHSLLFPWSHSFSPVSMRVCHSEKKFAVLFAVKFTDLSLNSEKRGNLEIHRMDGPGSSFGRITGAQDLRIGQLSLKLESGLESSAFCAGCSPSFKNYSKRSASIGSRRAAFLAG